MARSSPLLVLALHVLGLQLGIVAAQWGYTGNTGPAYWSSSYPICGQTSQSPIDLKPTSAVQDTFSAFSFTGYDTVPATMTVNNNGKSVYVSASNTQTVSGGGLAGARTVVSYHFHWGSNDSVGSEHTVDGTMYPLEMHIVHYDTQYGDVATAMNRTNGLAVLGFFFEISSTDNQVLDKITSQLASVAAYGSNTSVTPFALNTLLPSDLTEFYRYDGSLTTPACYESVQWTVFNQKLKVSAAQMTKFRALQFSDGSAMVNNYRPVQPLNSRTVKASFASSGTIAQPAALVMALLTIAHSLLHC